MIRFGFLALLTAFFITSTSPARAEIEHYDLDTAHTQILFFVDHLGFSQSQGEFLDYKGSFKFDRDNPENSSVTVTIQTDSIDMDHKEWNQHMKSADFFDVENHPTMTFVSTGIEVTGENTAQITGDLTLLGNTKPVTLDVTHNKSAKHPMSGDFVAGFSATTHVKRSDFGMDYGLPMIGDVAHILLEVEGIRKNAENSEKTDPDSGKE